MPSMKKLAERVRTLEEQLVVCIRCGMCQSVCPLYGQTMKEADVARGKLALLTGLMDNMFSDPDGVEERLNRCLLCGSCAASCPSGVNVLEVFITARSILAEYKGLPPAKKLIFKKMLARPGTFDTLVEWAGRFQNLLARKEKNAQGTSCARLLSPLPGNRHFLPLAPVPFHKAIGEQGLTTRGAAPRVAFFTGCIIDKIFPRIAHAAVTVFSHLNLPVFIPSGQGCCGIPALASGDRHSFQRLVDHHLDLFDTGEFDYLVTACATCTSTIRKLWPAVYPDPSARTRERIERLSSKTMDISAFLVDKAGLPVNEPPCRPMDDTVTYHDPCHLKKSLGVSEQPRQVIRAAGKTLVEMTDSDKCCGMGGSFNLYHYDLSSAIGQVKRENIENTGCRTVATGCPACMIQISDMLAKAGSGIRVVHPIELYARILDKL